MMKLLKSYKKVLVQRFKFCAKFGNICFFAITIHLMKKKRLIQPARYRNIFKQFWFKILDEYVNSRIRRKMNRWMNE